MNQVGTCVRLQIVRFSLSLEVVAHSGLLHEGSMEGPARTRSHAILIDKYADLRKHAVAFAEGHLSFVLLAGSAGLGKSRVFRELVHNRAAWIDGNATAFATYLEAFQYRDKPIVIDDSDGLLRDRAGVRLLKALTQTEKHRTVGWHSKAPEEFGVPRRFTTSSAVVVITNEWAPSNPDMVALENRSHFLHFAVQFRHPLPCR